MDYIWKQIKKDIIPEQSKIGRYVYIDIIKIVAAFFVVFYHYSFNSLDYGFIKGTLYRPNINRLIMSFAACSVPLFFMVNGALMFSRKRKWNEIYYKAAKIVFLIVCFSFFHFPSWFFCTLVILYFLYPVFSWAYEDHKIIYYSIIGAFLLFPFIYNEGTVLLKLIAHKDYSITGAKTLYSIVYFLVGNLIFREKTYPRWKSIFLILSGMGLLLFDCVIVTNYKQAITDGVNGAFPTLGALLLSVGVFELIKSIEFNKAVWISFISQGILPIYLLHSIVINYTTTLFGKPTNIFSALLGSSIICILCCCIGWVLKKIPVLCFLMKI